MSLINSSVAIATVLVRQRLGIDFMKPHTEIGKSLKVWWVSHDNVAVH